jgi:L-threonylcarbamoyladenylate synthase
MPRDATSKLRRVDPSAPDASVIAEAVAILRGGGLVAIPTETVYGLAARALDGQAVAKVFAAKGRPASHPLIAHVLGEGQARVLASRWPDEASRLARAFWPGPLTVVVERARSVPAAVAGGGESIALRAPSHPVARAVIAALGEPVAAPSANRYQGLSPTRASHVLKDLGDAVDLVIDAGPCDAGIESTVVDVRAAPARVLRPGALGLASLRTVVPEVQAAVLRLRGEEVRASPGMQERHYAPRAPLLVVASFEEAVQAALDAAAGGEKVGLVTRGRSPEGGAGVVVRALPEDPEGYARELYTALHELDEAKVARIVVEGVPSDEAWWAVEDRLRRATTP